ncbi:MAG: glycosyltransferase family 4 protein [Bacteroidales bacterium]|jgi:glycosyltransferase involved in cell wall biosynthesis|nr:glycosyltransferase family 4 protein [Bacteroidales bacterium]
MRIGFDAKRIFFNRSGLGNYGRNILSTFFDLYPENDYFLFTPDTDGMLFSKGLSKTVIPKGIYNLFPSWWRYSRIGHDARAYNLDVYHGLSNELPCDIDKSRAKLVVSVHDTIFMRYPQWYKWHDSMVYRQKTAFVCKKADAIIAVSRQTKDDLIRFFGAKEEKIHVIYQSCDAVFADRPSPQQQKELQEKLQLPDSFMLMVGNIEPRKNILNVIKATQYSYINMPLVIVGRNNAYACELKKQIVRDKLKNIYFYHDVCSWDLPCFYTLASVFVYPSFFEGFGIPILEALSCLTPVITANTSSLQETGGEAAVYVDPNSVEDIAQAIYRVLNDNELRKNNIEKGKEQIKKFAPNIIAKEIMNIYKQL